MIKILYILTFLGIASPNLAAPALQPLLALNHYNPLEPAYSRGAMAFNMGIGFEELQWSANPIANHQLHLGSEKNSASISLYNAFLNLGTRWPVDFGLIFSQIGQNSGTRLGGHIQWTIYQGFRLPSIAIRAHGSQIMGLDSIAVEGLGASLAMDYSLLRYFTFTGCLSLQRDTITYALSGNPSFQLGPEDTKESYISSSRTVGLTITLVPGALEVSIFEEYFEDMEKRYLAKIHFGF